MSSTPVTQTIATAAILRSLCTGMASSAVASETRCETGGRNKTTRRAKMTTTPAMTPNAARHPSAWPRAVPSGTPRMKAKVPPALVTEMARASWCLGTSSEAYGPVTGENKQAEERETCALGHGRPSLGGASPYAGVVTLTATHWIVTLVCEDRPGIVHAVSGAIVQARGNITESQQFSSDDTGTFFMRLQVETIASRQEFEAALVPVTERYGMRWRRDLAG